MGAKASKEDGLTAASIERLFAAHAAAAKAEAEVEQKFWITKLYVARAAAAKAKAEADVEYNFRILEGRDPQTSTSHNDEDLGDDANIASEADHNDEANTSSTSSNDPPEP